MGHGLGRLECIVGSMDGTDSVGPELDFRKDAAEDSEPRASGCEQESWTAGVIAHT